jgi:hypothetical protein
MGSSTAGAGAFVVWVGIVVGADVVGGSEIAMGSS